MPGEGTETLPVEVPAEPGEERPAGDALQENLLDRLLYKGVLPRYAFPTDVATFYVFDPTNSRRGLPAFRFTPSQGLAIALSQYAPGKEVWIANKRYTSGAIYSPLKGERSRAWQQKRLYYECRNCRFARTLSVAEGHRGEKLDCPACGARDAFGEARYWIRPPGFAHPVDWDEDTSPDDQPARSYATRAKLEAPSPPEGVAWTTVTPRIRGHYMREWLLVTNSGPRQEGYTYCTTCGRIEPSAIPGGELGGAHRKPYPDDRDPMCPGGRVARGICLGMDFITDILLLSLRVDHPVRLTPGFLPTEIALRTLAEALAAATCDVLGLEPGEVQADFRAALTEAGQNGCEAEVYLYDTLPGGAGFTRLAGERIEEVFRRTLDTLDGCDCDVSCYKCLRSFKNKFEHDRLDRHIGADLARYLLDATRPVVDAAREARAVAALAEDLRRQGGASLTVECGATIEVPTVGPVTVPILVSGPSDQQRAVCITHPLTAATPSDAGLEALGEFTFVPLDPVHEIKVRRSLPWVTRGVLRSFGLASG
ncbi:MAG TPA: DUF1998 domain-containing protein [Gemmatimonadales bacterium]|nr:DUF1998 domain-containing protein [Gemmatimonadales bacterium]